MTVLKRARLILTLCGCWRPNSWSTPYKKFMYTVYTAILVILKYSVMLTQLLDLFLNVENSDDLAASSYLLLSTSVSCVKFYFLLAHNAALRSLVGTLGEEPFAPRDDKELEIQAQHDLIVQSTMKYFMMVMESTYALYFLNALVNGLPERKLAHRAWVPFDYSSSSLFVFCFPLFHQLASGLIGTNIHICCEALFSGLLVHSCCQIEILGYRLKKITNDKKDELKACVEHHDCIYGYTAMINNEFQMVMFIQFFVSMCVLCFNMYQLTESESESSEFAEMIGYTACMMGQIFIYCYYGNEIKLKSMELQQAIYEIDWIPLDQDAKKSLLIIMNRSLIPIEFNSGFLVTLNLESFVNVLKTAYSAYNVLQQSKD